MIWTKHHTTPFVVVFPFLMAYPFFNRDCAYTRIIIASVVNIWLALPVLAQVINVLAVVIFTGLTAYDVQRLKEVYYSGTDDGKVRTLGALTLYLDFINIFVSLLQLIGNKR